ncbi:MAG: FlgO family outer membrane protein [Candidatus Magnetobacterium sp. LHC-1]
MRNRALLSIALGILLVPALLLASGCGGVFNEVSSTFRCRDRAAYNDDIIVQLKLKDVFDEVAAELCSASCAQGCLPNTPGCVGKTIIVTDFVDIVTLMPRGAGLFMSELMRNSINNTCCYKVVQGEFRSYFKLSPDGLVALTRNPNEIKSDEYAHSEGIVGTYKLTDGRLYLFVRRINVHAGNISKFVTKEISYKCMGDMIIKSVN